MVKHVKALVEKKVQGPFLVRNYAIEGSGAVGSA